MNLKEALRIIAEQRESIESLKLQLTNLNDLLRTYELPKIVADLVPVNSYVH